MTEKVTKVQGDYWEGGLEVLRDMPAGRRDSGHVQGTFEEARERANRLPEPERGQQLDLLDRWARESE